MTNLEKQAVNAIRILSAESIEKANSGHPGLPMGAATMAFTLWDRHLKHNPKNPNFIDRDRFILSAGHGSMLLYSLLHLYGYGLIKDDLQSFRQDGSLTPGHPEFGHTKGVEVSTGPLGQGVANAVGFAIAEKMLAAKFNKDKLKLVDHYTYALCGDGCMMEGISYEAASLAGTLQLGKLIVLYDSNRITIEGNTDITFTEDVGLRHKAMDWQVITIEDGEDADAIDKAIAKAKKETKKPSLIIVNTTIGFGAPQAGTADVHGSPLGTQGLIEAKNTLNWTEEPFEIPNDVAECYKNSTANLSQYEAKWNALRDKYKAKYPTEYIEFETFLKSEIPSPDSLDALWQWDKKSIATRSTSEKVLNSLADIFPNLIGGSADLAPSTKTYLKEKGSFSAKNLLGRNLHFGIREHAMAAICNGIALHGGYRVFCSTFFVFSDYMKHSMRLAALMGLPVIYILTHDSIGVGEDGPTHQPVEQLVALRSIPGLDVYRPADGKETTAAYISALSSSRPTAIICTRQNLPYYEETGKDALKGGYILLNSDKEIPDVILMASGSEVEYIVNAKAELKKDGIDARVVSMPCIEAFERQNIEYKESVLPSKVKKRLAIEAGSKYSWGCYVGLDGKIISIDDFGASAPAEILFKRHGFTKKNVVKAVKDMM